MNRKLVIFAVVLIAGTVLAFFVPRIPTLQKNPTLECDAAADKEQCLAKLYNLKLKNDQCGPTQMGTTDLPKCYCSPDGKYRYSANAARSCGIDSQVLTEAGWKLCNENDRFIGCE